MAGEGDQGVENFCCCGVDVGNCGNTCNCGRFECNTISQLADMAQFVMVKRVSRPARVVTVTLCRNPVAALKC